MAAKSNAKATEAVGELSPKQARLVQNKNEILLKVRNQLADLARTRSELTRIDQEMLKAGFQLPVLRCW